MSSNIGGLSFQQLLLISIAQVPNRIPLSVSAAGGLRSTDVNSTNTEVEDFRTGQISKVIPLPVSTGL